MDAERATAIAAALLFLETLTPQEIELLEWYLNRGNPCP